MRYIGSLDQGTSSTRFIIFDNFARIVGQHQLEHNQYFPSPGWVEHDATEIWQRSQEVISGALESAGLKGNQLSGIGITNQRETTVIWDKLTGEPLAPAIVWQDVRTQPFLDTLSKEVSESIQSKTGLTIAPYFSGSKINWLINNVTKVSDAIAQERALVGTIDSWLVWNLAGGPKNNVHVTDVTNASRTLLMDLATLNWDEGLLEIFGIPSAILPKIKSSSEIYGYTDPTGPLGSAVPIAGILGDQHAAMVGQTCFQLGDVKTTYGTGNFVLINTGKKAIRSSNGLLTTVCYKFGSEPAHYALEGSVAVTGSAIQWLRDQLQVIESAAEIEELARSVTDNGGVYFVPAFSGLFAPYWRSDARGVIVGLTRAATKAHLARAALEAICYQTREVIAALVADCNTPISKMRVDGGITNNELCMQMQADILQSEIVRPLITETTALGAAYAAGLATSVWTGVEELKSHWQISRSWHPEKSSELATSGYIKWQKAINRTLDWVE